MPGDIVGIDVLKGVAHKPQLIAQRIVRAGQIPGCGWQIMRANGGQRQVAVLLLAEWTAINRGVLKPHNRGTQYAAIAQHILDPRLKRAEVLTHNNRAGALRLQRENAQHRLMVEVHVRAIGWGRHARNPEQTEQSQNVVHADASRMGQHRAQEITPRLVAGFS